jgi:glutathione synthase/RimK-type ligase-like ATP-grasp enzyme
MNFKVCILSNENPAEHDNWIKACRDLNVIYNIVNLTKNDWMNKIFEDNYSCFLTQSPGERSLFKELYDERIYIICNILGFDIYPSLDEILIHENKRFLFYWLNAKKIPHPITNVFYYMDEATNFLDRSDYPIVAKTNIGSTGRGVMILNNRSDAEKYLIRIFSNKGIRKKAGPNLRMGHLFRRILTTMKKPKNIKKKLFIYKNQYSEIQKGFVIFQQYIPHDYEWRVVKIGDSYFAHKKIVHKGMASGSKIKRYDNPPLDLLDFVKGICDKHNLLCQAVDIFEIKEGQYLINELQTFFGQSDRYQMKVNGEIGRYVYKKSKWIFEKGDFNKNESYNLRLQHIIQILTEKNKVNNAQ